MKHPLSTTALLIFLFVAAQLIGLSLLAKSGSVVVAEDGKQSIEYTDTAIGERPQLEGAGSFIYIMVGVAVGTILVMTLIKFKAYRFWKAWFFLAVWFSTTVAVGVLVPAIVALALCAILSAWKVFWPNPIVHNLTELFMYAGIVILLAPLFTLWWVIALLAVISVYDMIAVWMSKHMVTMAQAQSKNNLFAGLAVPRGKEHDIPAPIKPDSAPVKGVIRSASKNAPKSAAIKGSAAKSVSSGAVDKSGGQVAILGGGDIAFPLIFSGVVMQWLVQNGAGMTRALYETTLVTLGATVALALLFVFAKKDKFYPAMPFLSAGCLLGFGLVLIVM